MSTICRTPLRLCLLIPPTPFSHKGRRGSLGILTPKTGEGTPLPWG
jgi:hypothetical protein